MAPGAPDTASIAIPRGRPAESALGGTRPPSRLSLPALAPPRTPSGSPPGRRIPSRWAPRVKPPRQGRAQGPPPCFYGVMFPGEPLPVTDLRSTIPANSPRIHIRGVLSHEHPPATVLSGQNRSSAPRLPFTPTTLKQSIEDCRRRNWLHPPFPEPHGQPWIPCPRQ